MGAEHLITAFGTIGLIAIVYAESGILLGLVFPGDSLLIIAGALAGEGKLNLAVILVGCFVAAVLGTETGYEVGKRWGPSLFRKPDSRIFKQEYVEQSRHFYERHGGKAVLLARFMPFVRTLAPMLAGIGVMPRRRFTAFNVVGAFIWSFGFILIGYFVGKSMEGKDLYVVAVVLVLSVAPIAVHLIRDRRRKSTISAAEAQAEADELHELLADPD